MKQIVEEVLRAEKEMGSVLERARAKASEIRGAAEKEVAAGICEARDQARQILQTAVEQARQEADRLGDERLKQADLANEGLRKGRPETLRVLVEEICKIILTTESSKDTP